MIMPEGVNFNAKVDFKLSSSPPNRVTRKDSAIAVMIRDDDAASRRRRSMAVVAAANKELNRRSSLAASEERRRRRMSHAAAATAAAMATAGSPIDVADRPDDGEEVAKTNREGRPVVVRRAQSHREVPLNNGSSSPCTTVPTAAAAAAAAAARHSASFQCAKRSSSFHGNVLRHNEHYQVLMLGGVGVGKSSLVRQFQTSNMEHIRIKVSNIYGDNCPRVDDAELVILDNPANDISAEMALTCCDADAYVVVYSVTDADSFATCQRILEAISSKENYCKKAAILVGNKVDLVRRRVISTDEGKACATAYGCKFIETSDWIDYNVDELFEGVLTQIRLRLDSNGGESDVASPGSGGGGSGGGSSGSSGGRSLNKKRERRNYRRSKTLGAKSWGMLKDLINKINRKVKSCDDLHAL